MNTTIFQNLTRINLPLASQSASENHPDDDDHDYKKGICVYDSTHWHSRDDSGESPLQPNAADHFLTLPTREPDPVAGKGGGGFEKSKNSKKISNFGRCRSPTKRRPRWPRRSTFCRSIGMPLEVRSCLVLPVVLVFSLPRNHSPLQSAINHASPLCENSPLLTSSSACRSGAGRL